MKRLLWKELREKGIWLLALVASAIGPLLYGDRYYFLGDVHTYWIMLPSLVALGFGASAYSSELAGGAADFIGSRPVSWKKLLATKLVVGVGFILVTAILAAGVYRLVCPEQYIRFADPVSLAKGAGIAALVMGFGYLLGFACSAVLPGMFGGLLILFLILISYALELMVYSQLKIMCSPWLLSIYFRFIGAAVATVLITRFGMTLPTSRRITKFSAIVGIFVLIGIPLNFAVKSDPFEYNGPSRVYNLSDDGKYTAMRDLDNLTGQSVYYLVRVADGKKVRIPAFAEHSSAALRACWHDGTLAAVTSDKYLWMVRMDKSVRLRQVDVSIRRPDGQVPLLTLSPNGRLIMFEVPSGTDHTVSLAFADLENLRLLKVTLSGVGNYWWQSDTEVGYTDRQLARHKISIVE